MKRKTMQFGMSNNAIASINTKKEKNFNGHMARFTNTPTNRQTDKRKCCLYSWVHATKSIVGLHHHRSSPVKHMHYTVNKLKWGKVKAEQYKTTLVSHYIFCSDKKKLPDILYEPKQMSVT